MKYFLLRHFPSYSVPFFFSDNYYHRLAYNGTDECSGLDPRDIPYLTKVKLDQHRVLYRSMFRNNLGLVRDLVKHFDYSHDDVASPESDGRLSVLQEAAYQGKFDVVKFLIGTFSVKRDTILEDDAAVLRPAAALGHDAVFFYLAEKYNLTGQELAPACHYAKVNRHTDMFEYCQRKGAYDTTD